MGFKPKGTGRHSRTIRSKVFYFQIRTYNFGPKFLTDVLPALIDTICGSTFGIITESVCFTVNLSKRKHMGRCLVLFALKYNFSRYLWAEKGFSLTSVPVI